MVVARAALDRGVGRLGVAVVGWEWPSLFAPPDVALAADGSGT